MRIKTQCKEDGSWDTVDCKEIYKTVEYISYFFWIKKLKKAQILDEKSTKKHFAEIATNLVNTKTYANVVIEENTPPNHWDGYWSYKPIWKNGSWVV